MLFSPFNNPWECGLAHCYLTFKFCNQFKSLAMFLGIDGNNKAKQLRKLFIAMTRIVSTVNMNWLLWVSIFTRISYVSTPPNDGKNSRSKNVLCQYCTKFKTSKFNLQMDPYSWQLNCETLEHLRNECMAGLMTAALHDTHDVL